MQLLALLGCMLFLSTGAYAFSVLSQMLAEPRDASVASSSGYTVEGVSYTLSTADPSMIAAVAFTVIPRSNLARITAVQAKLIGSGSNYWPCANAPPGSQRWSCAISGVSLAAADQLSMSVVDISPPAGYTVWLPMIQKPVKIALPLIRR